MTCLSGNRQLTAKSRKHEAESKKQEEGPDQKASGSL
jgi:hypothetical protein